MKAKFLCALLCIFSANLMAQTEIILTELQCADVSKSLSLYDFSPQSSGNSVIYKEYGLNNKMGNDFIDKTRDGLEKELLHFCGILEPTLEGLKRHHHNKCAKTCQDNSNAIFKKPLIGENTKQMRADTACMTVCNSSQRKLDAMISIAHISQKAAATKDCNGSVSNVKRESKPTILDGALEKERWFYDSNSKTKSK